MVFFRRRPPQVGVFTEWCFCKIPILIIKMLQFFTQFNENSLQEGSGAVTSLLRQIVLAKCPSLCNDKMY